MVFSFPEIFKQADQYLSSHQQELLKDTQTIFNRLELRDGISDYSFLVSPVAKLYEGFLKDFFLKIGLINQSQHSSDRLRVGKILNPNLRYKRFSVFQKLADISSEGEELAEILWNAWKYGRNKVFHYFPDEIKNIKRDEATEKINTLLEAIIAAGQFLEANPRSKY